MKLWYTPAELAEKQLAGFPTRREAVARLAKRESWNTKSGPNGQPLARRRKGRGGGWEYHIDCLPRPLRSSLTIRHIQSVDAPPMEEIFAGAHTMPEPPSSKAGELRRDAILLLLNFWDIYRSQSDLAQETARYFFVESYSNRKIEGIPDWVYKALTSASGNVKGVSVNTLRNWEKKRDEHQFTELAGNYGNRKGTGVLDTAEDGKVAQKIASLIVAQPHLTADHIRDQVRADFPSINAPSIRTFERWISNWKEDHMEALMKATDPDGFKNTKRFTGTNMNHWVKRPNQLWEIDASPADVLLSDGRYSIYACIDIWTRRMIVGVSKTATTEAVLALVRKAILLWGVPENIRTDNGSDFVSYRFKNALTHLAIHQDITAPFSPEQKGTVERAIGTLQRGLMPLLPGFIGHNVADRSKIEARKSFAQRLGCSDEKAFCVDLDHEELQATIDRWLLSKYEHNPHSGIGNVTPFEKSASWQGPLRRIENERALDILMAPLAGKDGMRTITKQGIRHDKASFIHPNLVPGDRVFCRQDPDDMGRLYVYDVDATTFICVAECPERLGVDPGDAIRAVRAAQADRMAEELNPIRRAINSMKPRDMIEKILQVNEADTATVTSFPKASEEYTSPALDAAANAIRPKAGPAPLSAEEEAEAEARFEAMEKSENVTILPTKPVEPSGPRFETDADFVVWVRANPDEATPGQKVYAAELFDNSNSIQQLVEEEENRRAANATA